MRAPILAALTLLTTGPSVALADNLDPWRGRGVRDATGSALARSARPNWDAVFGAAPESRIAGAPTIDVRRNFIYIQDTDGTLTIPFQRESDLNRSIDFVFQQIYANLPDEFVFIYFFTAFETGVGAFFYAPLVNTDRGIGQDLFNQRTGSRFLEGFVFMNDWQSFNSMFQGFPQDIISGFARSVFNQEAGHRWGAQFDAGPGIGDGYLQPLLGRDNAHWSYFAQTGGSPMEGNAWRDNGNGTFTTITNPRTFGFSDLDLYLMGLIPAAQVQPWFLIMNPNTSGKRDIYNQPLTAASPPQIFDPMTLSGTRRDYTIDDVVQRLGTRVPAAGQAPTRWRVVFAMLGGRNNGLNESQKVQFEAMVDMYAQGFRTGTRNLGTLDYALMGGPPLLGIGEACMQNNECAAEAPLCTRPAVGGNVCTRSCANASGCPNGFCCATGPDVGSNICMPGNTCPATPPDGGVVVPPDSGTTQPPPSDGGTTTQPDTGPAPCFCDLTSACDMGCESCDPECQPQVCACDTTTACDMGCESCDPECRGTNPNLPVVRDKGCGCATSEDGSAPLAGLAALAGVALWLARRRR